MQCQIILYHVLISAFFCFLKISPVYAQEVDTIYILDFTYGMDYYFKNKGCTLIVNQKDTIHLKATRKSKQFGLHTNIKGEGYYPKIKAQTVRVLKPRETDLRLDLFSEKTMWRTTLTHDTTLFFTAELKDLPWMFVNIVKINRRPFHLQMRMWNREFAWKNKYQRPRVRRGLERTVEYEYRLPEGTLSKVKTTRR